jgi:hypothetical protein
MTFRGYSQVHLSIAFFASCVALVWITANYSYPADPTAEFSKNNKHCRPRTPWLVWICVRSLLAAAIIGWMAGRSFWIGLWTLALALSLPLLRSQIDSSFLAETEVIGNFVYGLGFIALAHHLKLSPALRPPAAISTGELTAILFTAAIALYVLRGGTHIVRGILEKGRILPARTATEIRLDIEEYNRGRIIGNIERLILLTFVSIQAWSALAFLMAAKGLFRAKDLEKKEFSEYFLVGTLVSSMVAIAAGLLVQMVVKIFW